MKVIVIDICDTLYNENTTVGFIEYVSASNNYIYKAYKCRVAKVINQIILKFSGVDLIRRLIIKRLQGFEKEHLDDLAEDYLKNLAPNDKIITRIREAKVKNFDLVFSSASLEPVVLAVSKKFKAKSFSCSKLKYNKSLCSGRLDYDALDNKKEFFKKLSAQYDYIEFLTDNKGDINCLPYCQKFYAVLPNGKLGLREYWAKHGIKDLIIL